MKVYFRVDASKHIGSGHVMRCLSLAESLKAKGHEIHFVMRPQEGDLCDYTDRRGFIVKRLPKIVEPKLPNTTADYEAWLQVSLIDDAQDFLLAAPDAELIIIDHYGISLEWEKYVKSFIKCKQFAIDDLVRAHCADLILDQTYDKKAEEYLRISPFSEVLVGSKYALLNPKFSELHMASINKSPRIENHKLLITMGGVDNMNVTLISASSVEKDIKSGSKVNKTELSKIVAEKLAKKAQEKKIVKVYFDRGVYKYHGRVKVFAETLRKNGMEF